MVYNLIGLVVVLLIVRYLAKKGVINYRFPPIKLGYIQSYSPKKFHVSYGLYNGIDKHDFFTKPGEPVTLKYDLSVARGSLVLKVVEVNNILFEKKFKANMDEEDTITFTPEGRHFSVRIIGEYTMGGCDVDII